MVKSDLFTYTPDTQAFEKIWGIFKGSQPTPEQTAVELFKPRTGEAEAYRVTFNQISPSWAKGLRSRLAGLKDGKNSLFKEVVEYNPGKTNPGDPDLPSDFVTIINPEIEEHLVKYLEEKGVKLSGTPPKEKPAPSAAKEQSRTVVEWGKELAEGVNQDLEELYKRFEGNNGLRTQIRKMQKEYLTNLTTKEGEVTHYKAFDSRLKNFMEEAAAATRYEQNPKPVLGTLQERLTKATRELPPEPDKKTVRNEKLDKLTTFLRKKGNGEMADELEAAVDQPAELYDKLDEVKGLGGKYIGLALRVQATLNQATASIAR